MNKSQVLLACAFISMSFLACAAEEQTGELCEESPLSWPLEVRDTLQPLNTSADSDQIAAAGTRIEEIMNRAWYCRSVLMLSPEPSKAQQNDIMEWNALAQWLARVGDFMALNARGDESVSWRREYEIFLEVYEIDR